MEILKSFILFGIIENFILLMFYKYVGKIEKVRYWHCLILSVLFLLIGMIQFPFVKQIGMIVIMVTYLFIVTKNIHIKLVIFSSLYLLVIEMIFCIIFDTLFSFNFAKIDIYHKFFVMIPIRFVEIGLIIFYKRRADKWVGCGCRNLKDSKKTTKKLK